MTNRQLGNIVLDNVIDYLKNPPQYSGKVKFETYSGFVAFDYGPHWGKVYFKGRGIQVYITCHNVVGASLPYTSELKKWVKEHDPLSLTYDLEC